MKKAGFESGMYDGGKTFTGVSDNATQQKAVLETAVQQFAKLGFKVDMKYTTRDSAPPSTARCRAISRTSARAWVG